RLAVQQGCRVAEPVLQLTLGVGCDPGVVIGLGLGVFPDLVPVALLRVEFPGVEHVDPAGRGHGLTSFSRVRLAMNQSCIARRSWGLAARVPFSIMERRDLLMKSSRESCATLTPAASRRVRMSILRVGISVAFPCGAGGLLSVRSEEHTSELQSREN